MRTQGVTCCSYGANGKVTNGYDCLNIPGAEKVAATKAMVGSNLCGRSNGLVTTAGNNQVVANPTNSKSICCECASDLQIVVKV